MSVDHSLPGDGDSETFSFKPPGRPRSDSVPVDSPVKKSASAPLSLPGLVGRKSAPAIALPISRRQEEPMPQKMPTESSETPVHWVTDTVTTPANVNRQKVQEIITPSPLKSRSVFASKESLCGAVKPVEAPCAIDAALRVSGTDSVSGSPISAASSKLIRRASFAWDPKEALVWAWHGKLTEMYHNYTVENLLGQGRYGAVFVVQHKVSGHHFACKMLQKIEQNPEVMRSEIAAMKRLDHPNIVRIYETVEDKTQVFLLMELCNDGDLLKRIRLHGHLTEKTTRCFTKQLLSALAYCHDRGVVHRDVKPENILLQTRDNGCETLKLADFGVALSLRKQRSTSKASTLSHNSVDDMMGSSCLLDAELGRTFAGSLPYTSPEVLMHELLSPSPACDMWSCGVVIYAMLSGELPFADRPDLICSGMPPAFSGQLWASVSEDAIALVKVLLKPQVDERWTAKQALAVDWCKVASNRAGSPAESLSPDHRPILMTRAVTDGAVSEPARKFVDVSESPEPSDGESEPILAGRDDRIRHDLAEKLLNSLRRWKQMPKLRRISLAAIAKRLEASHPAQCLASLVYDSFKAASDAKLTCQELVRGLLEESGLDTEDVVSWVTRAGSFHAGGAQCDPSDVGKTLTGLHLRRRLMRFTHRIARATSKEVNEVPSPLKDRANQLVFVNEVMTLVDTLDAMKNGAVDYTLLVAALLQPDALSDRARIAEAFNMFDPRGQGKISPNDLQMTIKGKHVSSQEFKAMVSEYDLDGDGMLDQAEFEMMVRGEDDGGSSSNPHTTRTGDPLMDGSGAGASLYKVCPSHGGA